MKHILCFFFTFFAFATFAEDCSKEATPACLIEKGLEASLKEPEGWAITSLYEMLIATDPDKLKREDWLKKYVEFANSTKIEGIKERIPAITAEHLARNLQFDEAYKALGIIEGKYDHNAEPTILIQDEARSGKIKEALARIDKLVDEDSRDDTRLEVLNLAIEQKYPLSQDILSKFKDIFTKRLAQSALWGAKGDLKSFQKDMIVWMKGAKTENEFPYDTAENAKFESYDAYLLAALSVNNDASFKEGLVARGKFTTSDESDYVARLLRPMIRQGRADLIEVLGASTQMPAGEVISADEDLNKLKNLTMDQLNANIKASESIKSARNSIIDQTIETMILKGASQEAIKLFIDLRLNDLNSATYDQDRIAPLFEQIYRVALAKKLPQLAELTSKVTHDKGKDYIAKITGLQQKLETMQKANLTEEPSEEEWAHLLELLLHEGDMSKAASIIARIKEHGLRASAYTQLVRHLFEKNL